ncbi:geranylgeranyl reductase family [Thermoplasmatales archaeon BRNA1]|nr:geranylgeranyl reductase family [Thermoplasmatales archaeon BRNA1]
MILLDTIETDVLIVGSGPAGSLAARAAAEKGVRVTFIERRPEVGVPVRCGELVPSVQEIKDMFPNLERADPLFDLPDSLRCRDVEGIRLIDPRQKVREFPFTGYTTDRDRFDQYLADQAVSAGAELIRKCAFDRIEDGIAKTSLFDIRYKVIIGADGPGSRVAQAMGLPANRNCYPAVSAQAEGDFDPVIQMFFGRIAPGAYGWIMPKDGRANVGVGFSPKFSSGSLSGYMERFVKDHGLKLITPIKGKYVPSEGPISRTVTGNCMLAGDAAGVVMPVNGGGIPQAMITGRMAGEAAAENILDGRPLEVYEQEWKNVLYKPLHIAAGNKRLADRLAFKTDRRTALCMSILGTRRMGKLIRCKRLFP